MNAIVPEADLGKTQFQEELNKWFESRGIIADLRSHLRHLMITALQNTQIGMNPSEKTSPKAQALNLIVAEYLLRHRCHYTLSVFTSEVPTLSNFCVEPGSLLQGKNPTGLHPKRDRGFQEKEVEEIFNALGLSSCAEELGRAKSSYLQENNETSLMEFILQTNFEMSTKLHIRENLESYQEEEGERLLSKQWHAKIADVLLSKNIKPPQIAVIEEAIFRITESEIKRIRGEEHRLQMEILADRERRIQEYLRRHEDEIIDRLTEAEKDLTARADEIDKELCERHRHLCKLALEWNDKHEEIVKLAQNFYNIENENKRLQEEVEELKAENKSFKEQRVKQSEAINELKGERSSLIERLKEVLKSNAVLGERVEALISRENKEVPVHHEEAKQEKPVEENVPLIWSKNKESGLVGERRAEKEETENQGMTVKVKYYENWNVAESSERPKKNAVGSEKPKEIPNSIGSDDENEVLLSRSSSSEEVLSNARKKLKDLEAESNRINKNYMDYKLKGHSLESASECSSDESQKTPQSVAKSLQDFPLKDSKFCQTGKENKLASSVQKSDERFKTDAVASLPRISRKTSEETLPRVTVKEPTKRQLENRNFFLKSRQLLQEFEKRNAEELHTSTSSNVEVSGSSSEEPSSEATDKKAKSREDLVLLTPLRTTSFYCNDVLEARRTSSSESFRKSGPRSSSSLVKVESDCLALLEETRIKSPHEEVKKKSLRQQVLLTDDEEEKMKIKEIKSPKRGADSINDSASSGKMSVGKGSDGDGDFW